MKAHIEIRIRLKSPVGSLHDILRGFAQDTHGWNFPEAQSNDYQDHHAGQAGFAEHVSENEAEHAAVAIANTDAKRPNTFKVTNIIPQECSSLTLDQYNAVGLAFAEQFQDWLKTGSVRGSVETLGPEKNLEEIIPGPKSRKMFEAWLQTPTPVGHPSDLYVLDCFICHLFRHRGSVQTYEIEKFLVEDKCWKPETARWVVARIETGLELLRVDRRF